MDTELTEMRNNGDGNDRDTGRWRQWQQRRGRYV